MSQCLCRLYPALGVINRAAGKKKNQAPHSQKNLSPHLSFVLLASAASLPVSMTTV